MKSERVSAEGIHPLVHGRDVSEADVRLRMRHHPDDLQGSEYSLLRRGVQKIVREHKLDADC
eukprot:12139716-Heterocapsa_arctica.AAC.1